MGTWEEESSELLESRNEINNDVVLDGAYRCGDNVDVKVEVVNDNDDNVDGHECGDRENNVDIVEGDLVQQFERAKLENSGCDGYAMNEEMSEQHGEYDGDDGKNQVFPLRPYAEDCSFYVKTGSCKFGQNCREENDEMKPGGDKEKGFEGRVGSVGDAGKIKCKYFQSPGGCKFGDACRYNHSSRSPRKIEKEHLELNFLGLPIRPSAQGCTYYLQTGSCGYGANCRFNHPDPSAPKQFESGDSLLNGSSVRVGISAPGNYAGVQLHPFGGLPQEMSGLPNGINIGNPPRYAPQTSAYHQPISLTPGWNQNQVTTLSPANKYPLPHQIVNNTPKRVDPLAHYENLIQIQDFPERPGQADCDYFMKTGTCKYRSACRYNHPKSQVSNLPLLPLSSRGLYSTPATMLPAQTSQLHNSNTNNMRNNGRSSGNNQNQQMQSGEFPERGGQPDCDYYIKTGQCKYKSACRYNHPRSRMPTASLCALSVKGLPLRPGAKFCRNYEQEGKCKYGRNCLYDHPDDYSTDVPVSAHFHNPPNVPTSTYLEPQWPAMPIQLGKTMTGECNSFI